MKSKLYVTLLIVSLLALLATGCGKEAEKTEVPSDEVTETTAEVDDTSFEAIKDGYLAEAKLIITDWDGKLSSLEEKKNALPDLTQKPLDEPLKAVMDSKAALDQKFTDLQGAGEDTFGEKKTAFEGSVGELQTGYDNIMGMF